MGEIPVDIAHRRHRHQESTHAHPPPPTYKQRMMHDPLSVSAFQHARARRTMRRERTMAADGGMAAAAAAAGGTLALVETPP